MYSSHFSMKSPSTHITPVAQATVNQTTASTSKPAPGSTSQLFFDSFAHFNFPSFRPAVPLKQKKKPSRPLPNFKGHKTGYLETETTTDFKSPKRGFLLRVETIFTAQDRKCQDSALIHTAMYGARFLSVENGIITKCFPEHQPAC